jgi:antitoxin (DNA-binding transcriptional repressor) of toxin-antitoxin stability system
MGIEDHLEISLDELHHRIHDVRDHLFKGETIILNSEGRPLATIRPMEEEDKVPEQALVRSISYIRHHKRVFTFKLREGNRIILTYRGRKMGVADPELPEGPA